MRLMLRISLVLAAQGPTVERITVHGASLEGNLEGNSADRIVFVVPQPAYATHLAPA